MPAVSSPKQAGELARSNEWQVAPAADSFQASRRNDQSRGMRAIRSVAWNLLPPLTFVAMVGCGGARSSSSRSPPICCPGPGGVFSRLVTDASLLWTHSQGHADRDPAGLRPHDRHRDSARPPDRAVAAGEAGRLSADHAAAAGAEDRGRTAVSRLARVRHRVEGPADRADDVLSAAAREHQRFPDPRRPAAVSHEVDGRDAGGRRSAICDFRRRCRSSSPASRRRRRSPRRRPSSPSSSAPTRASATCCCAAPARWTSSSCSPCWSC